jgi:cellulose biosynthesis protein BcsQ
VDNLFLVPSHLDLSGAELELASAMSRETLLRDAINLWEAEAIESVGFPPADYVLLDCPPSLGLLSINALVAAEEVMIAVQTEFFALQGLSKLVEVIQLLRRRMNPALTLTGILPCLYDSRLKLAREVLAELRRFFPGKVYPTPVRTNVRLAESPSHGMTIFEYAPESNGASDYQAMGEELMRRSPTEDRPKPSPVEVVNDDQAKELQRAAVGLRELEAPKPDHWNQVDTGAPVEGKKPVEIAQTEASEVETHLLEPQPGPATPGSNPSSRVADEVDAELATYQLPRTKPGAPAEDDLEPEQAKSTPMDAQVNGAPESDTDAGPTEGDSVPETPETDGPETESTALAPETTAPEVHPNETLETDVAPPGEPEPNSPEPTPVMGFGSYIGEDRWTRTPRPNNGG